MMMTLQENMFELIKERDGVIYHLTDGKKEPAEQYDNFVILTMPNGTWVCPVNHSAIVTESNSHRRFNGRLLPPLMYSRKITKNAIQLQFDMEAFTVMKSYLNDSVLRLEGRTFQDAVVQFNSEHRFRKIKITAVLQLRKSTHKLNDVVFCRFVNENTIQECERALPVAVKIVHVTTPYPGQDKTLYIVKAKERDLFGIAEEDEKHVGTLLVVHRTFGVPIKKAKELKKVLDTLKTLGIPYNNSTPS